MSQSIHADASQTVRISVRRFEPSPYHELYANDATVLGVYAGRFYPASTGEDTVDGYWTLRRKAVLYDVPERPVQIEGPDVVPFLERVFARRIGNLKEGRGRYAVACTPSGGLFMDGILFRLSETCFWYVQPDGPLEAWLAAHSAGFDVTVSDPHSRVLQIQGPTSQAVLHDASGGAIDQTMGYFHAGFFELGGQTVYVSRTGWTGELGFEVYSLGDRTDHPRLWRHLLEAGAAHGMIFSGLASMEIRRIEAGILDNLTDFDMTMSPFEAGLGGFIDIDKPGFVGREALLEADRGKLLYGLKCPAAVPAMGGAVLVGQETVGHVTAGAWSPFLESGVGYLRFDRPGDWAGKSLALQSAAGDSLPCEIVDLPFYDPEKRIPRGLDRTIP